MAQLECILTIVQFFTVGVFEIIVIKDKTRFFSKFHYGCFIERNLVFQRREEKQS